MAQLTFWFEFASTYSYLSAMRIEELGREAGVEVVWRPFLLGAIFKALNMTTSPFNLNPVKGRYMVRDVTRIAQSRGLVFRLPDPFPQNSLLAARLALVGLEEGWGVDFARALFKAEFAEGKNIADAVTLATALTAAGATPEQAFARAEAQDIKDKLRRNTAEAEALGIFGAPSFVTAGGELFWGDDRLEQALA